MINMGLKTAITLINVQHMEGGGRGQGPPGRDQSSQQSHSSQVNIAKTLSLYTAAPPSSWRICSAPADLTSSLFRSSEAVVCFISSVKDAIIFLLTR